PCGGRGGSNGTKRTSSSWTKATRTAPGSTPICTAWKATSAMLAIGTARHNARYPLNRFPRSGPRSRERYWRKAMIEETTRAAVTDLYSAYAGGDGERMAA